MYMVEKLDAGDILTQVRVPIEEMDNVGTMFKKLSVAGAKLLVETIPLLKEGKITKAQDEAEATYAPNIKREDEEIDWMKHGEDIYNQIRGLSPFPVAYSKVDGEILKIWSAAKTTDFRRDLEPGSIYRLDDTGIGVVAGDGACLLLTDIQPAGKKRMSAADFLRGAGSHWDKKMKLGV